MTSDNNLPGSSQDDWFVIRPAVIEDYSYILSSWSREFHKVTPYNFRPNEIYFPYQKEIINKAIESSQTLVACLDGSPDDIVGYICAKSYGQDNIVLHWCQVKAIYRRLGVAKALLQCFEYQNKNIVCTHYFKSFKDLKDKYNLVFDDTLLMEKI